jgi:hypothetical protein
MWPHKRPDGTSDLADVYAYPRQAARALERRGLLHRLEHGYYCAVPAEHDPALWQPTIEAAAAGIATAIYGDRVPVLTTPARRSEWAGPLRNPCRHSGSRSRRGSMSK